MPYIRASQQPVGHPGRTYHEVSYHHDDGADWIALVGQVEAGETEITDAEYQALRESNFDYNVVYEPQRIAAEHVAVDAVPTISAADRRAWRQAVEDAVADGKPVPALPGLTVAEKEAQHLNLDAQLLMVEGGDVSDALRETFGLSKDQPGTVEGWQSPKGTPLDHDLILAEAAALLPLVAEIPASPGVVTEFKIE